MDTDGHIAGQLAACDRADVAILCCPEAVIGGPAHESDGQSPFDPRGWDCTTKPTVTNAVTRLQD